MRQPLPTRFWIEFALGIASGILTALTAVWPDWIERIFGFDPDAGSGSTEWGLVLTLAGVTVVFIALSSRTWWRYTRLAERL